MDPVIQRLDPELLDKEIANATAESKGAQEAWLSATDPQQEPKLEKVWQQLVKDKKLLLAGRKALTDQLTGPGYCPRTVFQLPAGKERRAEHELELGTAAFLKAQKAPPEEMLDHSALADATELQLRKAEIFIRRHQNHARVAPPPHRGAAGRPPGRRPPGPGPGATWRPGCLGPPTLRGHWQPEPESQLSLRQS
ncbi:hypothetical protein COCSUDRAFT_63336 [Coccomyxa subellipsoidea C-169]|uniref:Uncharacterized protein n=1 Tax=Coccomyxa subellipsoidea (strain C-169) TaxID=574566 RepID=I0YX20_COCSC|nr:hypothetical protein COCSUDRAFT_63336 [Coccomyxa subellipsoidea C-169]EIE22939.1 hypothetical protein COCSUDRAFT_63336 [Coccomyxa subellipsoidea C-169]|eukprot:XP_005647483.1 hypothetical protein COCSUDRAFT_63336 [Coccomyxa subellipsoidea C-169]